MTDNTDMTDSTGAGLVGVIGGSGFYEFFAEAEQVKVETPFGEPSDSDGTTSTSAAAMRDGTWSGAVPQATWTRTEISRRAKAAAAAFAKSMFWRGSVGSPRRRPARD